MRSRVGWMWRVALAVFAFGLALYAFRQGVVVSDRQEVLGAGILTHVYYSLGLFVLGGLDLGVSIDGPTGAQNLLWHAYLLAPSVTHGVFAECALRLLRPGLFQRSTAPHHHSVVWDLTL